MPKNLEVDTLPDPLRHFGVPWRPFWILQAVRRCRRLASAPFAARLVLTIFFTTLKPDMAKVTSMQSFFEKTLDIIDNQQLFVVHTPQCPQLFIRIYTISFLLDNITCIEENVIF